MYLKLTDATFWRTTAQQLLKNELTKKPILSKAKNVILFLGDGLLLITSIFLKIHHIDLRKMIELG